VLGAERIAALDHRRRADGSVYAHICDVPGLGSKLELRLNPGQAEKHRGFDPVTIAVTDKATLQAWAEFLDRCGIKHSRPLAGVQAWLLVFDDRNTLARMKYAEHARAHLTVMKHAPIELQAHVATNHRQREIVHILAVLVQIDAGHIIPDEPA
jgi:hypothetical protein